MKKQTLPLDVLSPRLRAAAELVAPGARIADVGTDHAYLPIALVGAGICPAALASDIRKGPLDRAADNIARAGLSGRIAVVLCDGLSGVESFHPDTILICGMGGELIVSILERADFVRDSKVRLILQPMTMAHKLRLRLAGCGFAIEDETLVRERDRRLYQLIAARYDGIYRPLTPAQAYLGPVNLRKRSALLPELADACLAALNKRKAGLESSGRDEPELSAVRAAIADIETQVREVGL